MLFLELLNKAKDARDLEAAKAYVDAALLAYNEQDKATVVLESANGRLINAIKAVRAETGLGLREAKDFVEKAPSAKWGPISRASALRLCKALANEGCTARIE